MDALHGLLLAVRLAVSPAASPTAADAAALQYAGEPFGAFRISAKLVQAHPEDATARLVGACAALETGQLRSAHDLLAPLELGTPPSPRAVVLRALLERRLREPDEPFMQALAAAWSQAGRPDLTHDEPSLDVAGRLDGLGPTRLRAAADRLLFAPPVGTDARAAAALAAAAELDGAPAVLALQILGTLSYLECPADPAEWNAAAARALAAARDAMPRNGYVEVAGFLARCPRRLTGADVARLATAGSLPEFGYPRQSAFEELLTRAEQLDRPNARRRAIAAWLALDVAAMQLRPMLEAESDPELRRRAARAVERIGRRLAEGTAWVERLVGLSLAQAAASLLPDDPTPLGARRWSDTQREVYRTWAEAKAGLGRWPFAAEWREWTPDETRAAVDILDAIGEGAR
jgi:hypothetical protein